MEQKEFKVGNWLQEGFELYKQNFALMLIASLLTVLLGALTFDILLGPLAAGMMAIVLRLLDKQDPKPEIGDVFKGFNVFLDAFLLVLACIAVILVALALFLLIFNPVVAGILMVLLAIAVHALFALSICFIADKKLDFWQAVTTAVKIAKSAILPLAGVTTLTLVLSGIGFIAFGIGVIVTMPFYWCVMALVYRDVARHAVTA